MNPWDAFDACVTSANRIVQDIDTARDIATEVCGSFVDTGIDALDLRRMTMLARWRALDHTRKGRLEIVRGFDIERAISSGPTPEQELQAKQTRQAIANALSTDAYAVVALSAAGYTDAEIGRTFKKSEVAVRQVRSRARRKIINVGE